MTGYTAATLAVVGAVVSTIGIIQQGRNANKAAKFNAQVAGNNATAARNAAAEDARRHKRLAMKRAGANRAIDPDKLDLLEDNAIEEELAFQSIIHAGEVEAVGFQNNVQIEIMRGRAAQQQATTSAFGALLSGVGSAFKPGTGVPTRDPTTPFAPTSIGYMGGPSTRGIL